jgi:acyl-coenzyme A thioesterase 9
MTPGQTSITRRLRFSTDVKLRRRFMVIDEDVAANIRAGLLLEVLDKLAEDTALRFARTGSPDVRVVTAAMDDLKVYGAPDIKRDIVLRARVNYVGNTSMEIGVRLEHPAPEPVHLGSCFFTMVARLVEDGKERSMTLPALHLVSAMDKRRASRAEQRRKQRRQAEMLPDPSAEEYAMLRRLHDEFDRNPTAALRARDLVTEGWERTYPEHENVPQKIFGGFVAHRAYMYAHLCAERLADHRAMLVASDRIDFYQPVRMGDKLHFVSRITFSGQTSLTVETQITRISRDRSMTALSNTCVFTFVNVDPL